MASRTIFVKIVFANLSAIMLSLINYERLEVDEFWTYADNKGKKYWLIYAYEHQSGAIVAYWGKRD
ncbi:hypothetical protein EZS27_017859 [termite gut metagenome]|uniref:Uncharacterized protein n=1 Tax=termite gut metagenome TaxID=433724 RepID=A0A5J4RKV2_9ZZZZ